jgi:hypothetical protein
MACVTVGLAAFIKFSDDPEFKFYRFGPNPDLKILGFTIDVPSKYVAVVLYCVANSMIRTLIMNVLHPWLINNVQDETRELQIDVRLAYQVTSCTSIYTWFDWFIYMNILLTQIDMVLVEMAADLVMANLTTFYYMRFRPVQYTLHANKEHHTDDDDHELEELRAH